MSLILSISSILLSVVAVGLVLFFQKKISNLESLQEGLHREINALAVANKRILERLVDHEKKTKEPPQIKTLNRKKPANEPVQKIPEPTPEQESLWQDVIFLAKQGLSADTIAKDLSITRGEVELILGLHNFKPKE